MLVSLPDFTMNTQDFRTKTLMIERANISASGMWGVAVDIGYSGVKLFSPNTIACFPAFAIPVKGEMLGITTANTKHTILFRRDETSQVWLVGKAAQDAISRDDPDTSSMSIFGRQRYNSDMFRVLSDTALGIACTKNAYGDPAGKPIVLESGLPNAYLKVDSQSLREVFEGFHAFDLKVGEKDWQHYEITLVHGNVAIMPQPMGTLLSVATGDDGKLRSEANKYYSSATLICDPGFGTFDCFSLRGSSMDRMETFDSLGMKQVLMDTSKRIFEKYPGTDVPVPAMQAYLEKGTIPVFNRKLRTSANMPFGDILEECSKAVAMRAIEKIDELYDLVDYDYMILTGGTGEAWYGYFKDAYKGMSNLTLIPGNQNTMGILQDENGHPAPLPFIFSNVRGYYMYLNNK